MISENMLLSNKFFQRLGFSLFALLVVLPFAAGLMYALLYAFGLTGILSNGFSTSNFITVIKDGEVFRSIGYSIYIAATSIILSLFISFSWLIFFKSSLIKNKSSFILYLPLVIPSLVAAFLSFELFSKSGLFSRILFHAHVINNLQQFPDLINDKFGIGIICTHVLMATPFFFIYFSNIYEAANINALQKISDTLGARTFAFTTRITLPLIVKKSKPTILLYFIFVLGSYEIPLILGRQSPQMISILVVRKLQRFNLMDIPQGYCISLIYTIMLLLLLVYFFRTKEKSVV